MLPGRLGLDTARIPHVDRHGLVWLARGHLKVESGTLRFQTAGGGGLDEGDYAIPFQMVSVVLLGPGSTVSHDALRLCARHGTCLVAVGQDGVRAYTAPALGPDDSSIARAQATMWADPDRRITLARRMYAWRMGEVFPHRELAALRGMEGARMRALYKAVASQYGVPWHGRRYDRANPEAADLANQAINHAATAVEAAASVAVTSVGALPQLGFIHEASGIAFVLDVADLYRGEVTLPVAFRAVRAHGRNPQISLERQVRRLAGRGFRKKQLISTMIGRIKEMFNANVRGSDE
ncbi:MAG: type I-E CRISPR-associated endonuclease Cas1e [Bryobacterales bacterium]|nr:type I-E CRISPR-associated endonuclease Cas1e [Bryobacterales bacterium]